MKTIARLLLIAAVPAMTACSDSSGPDEVNVTGTYNLQTINNSSLPFVILQIGTEYRAEILSARITLNSNGTFTDEATVRETESGTVTTTTENDGGTYTQANNAVQLRYVDEFGTVTTINAAISGNTMTIIESGFTFVFRK